MPQTLSTESNGVAGTSQTRLRSEQEGATRDRTEDSQGSPWCTPKWPSPKTLAIVLAVASLLVTAHSWGDQSYITKGMLWMRAHEQQGRVWFVVAYTACLLLLLPASVLALLAGACFGLLWGVALVYLANIIGQTIAFLLARSYLHDRLYALVTAHWPQFTSVDTALRREGWRLVFVLRLSPCVPFVVLNYALGLTSISFLEYSLASAVSIIPFVVISVYLGLASGTALQLLDTSRWPDRPDRALINPQSTHSSAKSVSQHDGAHKGPPPPPPPHGNLAATFSTAAATAESTGMYRDASMPGASTTLVTVATCALALVTGIYAVWFIRRVTTEVLEEEPCDNGGATGGLVGLSLFADSSIDIAPGQHKDGHRDVRSSPSSPFYTSSLPSSALHSEKRDTSKGAAGWQSPPCAASRQLQAAAACDASQAADGEADRLIPERGKGSGLHSREPSTAHSSLQQRWPRWTGSITSNIAQAARTAVGASMLPTVPTESEASEF